MLGLVKIVLFPRVSSIKYGIRDVLEQRASGALHWLGTIKSKTKGSWTYVGKTRPDHAIRGSVAITKLPLGCDIQKKKKKTTKWRNAIF